MPCVVQGISLQLSMLRSLAMFHLLFENPLTFNCFWAIKNFADHRNV